MQEEKLYKVFRFGTKNFDALCQWLEKMSSRGYFLHSVKGHLFFFTKNAPCQLEYHVEYISANVNDTLQYVGLCGWNYICSDNYLHFFCCNEGKHYYTGAFYKRSCYTERKQFFRSLLISDTVSVLICLVCCLLIAPKLSSPLTYILFFLILLIGVYCLGGLINNALILSSINSRLTALPRRLTPSATAELVTPSEKYAHSFLDACLAYKEAGSVLYDINTVTDAHNLIYRLNAAAQPQEGREPFFTYWLVDNGSYVGSANLRLSLTEDQRKCGGNIAYEIRPEMRLRGYGTVILSKMLDEAMKKGLENVILTCEADNISAVNTIENCGGKLMSIYVANLDGFVRPTRIYNVSLRNIKNDQ